MIYTKKFKLSLGNLTNVTKNNFSQTNNSVKTHGSKKQR
jgi:hypothetical protein